MHAKGYTLGYSRGDSPKYSSSNIPILPLVGYSDLSHPYVTKQAGFSTDWRKHPGVSYIRNLTRNKIAEILSTSISCGQVQQASDIVAILEHQLFIDAASEDEYMNQETLVQRLQTQLHHKLLGTKNSHQVDSSLTVQSSGLSNDCYVKKPGVAFQNMVDARINSTNHCTMTENSTYKYGFRKGGLSHPFVAHEIVSADESSSITTCTDIDGFSNFGGSGGLSNVESSSQSFGSHFQQPHVDDAEMDLIKYRGLSGSSQKNKSVALQTTVGKFSQSESLDSLIPQHSLTEISEVSNHFPTMSSSCHSSHLQDLQQHQLKKFDIRQNYIQQNSKHLRHLYQHCDNTFMAQSRYEPCHQKLGKKTFKQDQLLSRHSNSDQQFALGSSAFLNGSSGSPSVNSCGSSQVYAEYKILMAYFRFKNLNNLPGNNQISFIRYLHSKVCANGICACEQYSSLVLHFDNCQSDDCHMCWPIKLLCFTENIGNDLEFSDSISAIRDYGECFGNSAGMLQPTKRQKMEPSFGISAVNNEVSDPLAPKMAKSHSLEGLSELHQQPESSLSIYSEVTENNVEQFTSPMLDSACISGMRNSLVDDTFEQTFESETILSEHVEGVHTSEELHPKSLNVKNGNLQEMVSGLNSSVHPLPSDPSNDIKELQSRIGFDQTQKETTEKEADLEKVAKFSNPKRNRVSLAESFTCDQIREHIMSLQQPFGQSTSGGERGIDVNSCQLCADVKLVFAPVPIYCLCCGTHIKRNAHYYCRRAEEFDTQYCFCTSCHRASRGAYITFNGISIAKTMLERKRNDELIEEWWVQCDKCERWQHQICALFNNNRDLEGNAEYVCPRCCLEEINNGLRMPLPESATFGAKDLPRTLLSNHIEQRLFKRLKQERIDRANVEGKNVDEVPQAENLAVRVVLSVDKQLKVKKQFLDIFCEENYPAEFPYRSKVILLFQKIEGVDVCLFAMPQRQTVTGEALRTFVYHQILIGYLDFCKKRGFTTCYIWACPPLKGEDYVLYCHPESQKTPKNDKLRQWYQSMLRKAAKENIVVGFTNIYDRFFVPTGKTDSKVSAAHLPYFDGDYWSGAAMDLIRRIEQGNGGEYQKKVKKIMTKRTLKAMGHTNPSEGIARDILVMQKLGQTILPVKEDFMVVNLQYACTECHEVILSGKRWFCSECKNFQLCERCHTADIHTSAIGEKHTLCQVLVDDIPLDTKEDDIILDNGLFENRHNFLSFCQKSHYQFDTLRRAKHSSIMILYNLKNPTLLPAGKICSICCQDTVFQQSWQCETCPQFTVCSACYRERGASCHTHRLSQCASTALCETRNKELKLKSALTRKLLEVLKHASQCHSTRSQPCSYPNCLQIKKLFCHASRCTVRAAGGCQHCKKAWLGLSMHSRNCRDSNCLIPRCMDLKKHAEWIAMQSESRRRAAVAESVRGKQ
ncbi:hypothetical protein L6164_006530 [Bauhinia variegata]|uniref:Uncharacterized protein n=1 Tax=Bauhinia variegata TaxID=167791 RepID=A0ACB9PXE9_BAUVA|nr:hypothetical protein L6164_006530 [Bauhinia variegata]